MPKHAVCVCFSVWYVATIACTAFTFLCKARCVLSHSWLWLIGPFRSCEGVGILNCSFLALLFFSLLNCLLFSAPWASSFFPLSTSVRLRNSHPGKLQQHFVLGFCVLNGAQMFRQMASTSDSGCLCVNAMSTEGQEMYLLFDQTTRRSPYRKNRILARQQLLTKIQQGESLALSF